MRNGKGKGTQFLFYFTCFHLFAMLSVALCSDSTEVVFPQDGTKHDLRRHNVPFEISWTFGRISTGDMQNLIGG
jgi:hypothetical protein